MSFNAYSLDVLCLRVLCALAMALSPISSLAQTHPRLLFDAADIPDLQAKILTEPYASMHADLLALKDAQDDTGDYGPSYPAVRNGFLYVLTGDTGYATASLGYVDQVLANPNWAVDSYKSLGRAMLGKGVALAYDFCYDAWSQPDRDRVSLALKANADSLMASGGSGWPGDGATANNWHGVRYSGAILCYLACDEAGVDISTAYEKLRTHLQAKYGTGPDAHGWDVEGLGYVRYPWGSFIGAAGIVLQRLQGIDMIAEAPGAGFALWAIWPGVLPLPTYSNFLNAPIVGLHPDYSDDNPNFQGEGSHGLSFYYAPPGFAPGIKWMYDRIGGALGDQTWDNYRHGTIYSILYYPDSSTPSENPEAIPGWGLNYEDERHGMLLFRDRYQDADDLVTQFNAKQQYFSNTHAGSDLNGFRIFGLGSAWSTGSGRTGKMGGQTTVFKSDPGTSNGESSSTGHLLSYYYQGDGGGYADIMGSSTGVSNHIRRLVTDYSQASGTRGVWVVRDRSEDGTLWRLNTPGMNSITPHTGGFTITAPNGNRMEASILHPAGVIPTIGTFDRGSNFTFESISYSANNYVQFPSGDGDFLVVLTVVESGEPSPAILPISGSGMDQVFSVGPETFVTDGGGLLVSGWTGGELAPWAGIDYPVARQYFRAGTDLLVEARAGDLDGTVSEVRFYSGDTLLGSDTSAPFEFLWSSVPAGNPTLLKVVAVDDLGNESIPTAVSFRPVVPKDARSRIEAEDYDANSGSSFRDIGGVIGYLNSKGWARYDAVDFGSYNPTTVTVDGSKVTGGSCYFRLDSLTGPIIATVEFYDASGPYVASIDPAVDVTGIRDLFFTYASGGPGIANVDAFEFSGGLPPPEAPVVHPYMDAGNLMVRFDTVSGVSYTVKSSPDMTNWTEVSTITGDGSEAIVPVPVPGTPGNKVFAIVEAF
ncbi:MAG: Ig-like domain-containing protein [Oceanipulchritudo sp.]